MGWLRIVGSLKLQVFFAKEPYKRDDILQERVLGGWVGTISNNLSFSSETYGVATIRKK